MTECVVFHQNMEVHPRRFNREQWDWAIKQGPDQKNWALVTILPSREHCIARYSEYCADEAFYDSEDVRKYFVDWELEHILICLPPLYDPMPTVLDTGDKALDVWELFLTVGDRVGFKQVTTAAGTKPKENYTINLDAIKVVKAGGYYSFPRQAQQILDSLIHAGLSYYKEADLERHMADLVASRTIKTRQEPWRIFQFYRPQFLDAGLVERGS